MKTILRNSISKQIRQQVHEKYCGRCAYCGEEIQYKDMQVDHLVSLYQGGADEVENMMPACRSCNHYKRASGLEAWRKQLESTTKVLSRDCYTYRNAVRFGQVTETPHKVVFYFEKEMSECAKKSQ